MLTTVDSVYYSSKRHLTSSFHPVRSLTLYGDILTQIDGEGWIKLRTDDFSDIEDHYTLRGPCTGEKEEGVAELSGDLLEVIKGMMRKDPITRWTLEDVKDIQALRRIKGMKEVRPALVDEPETFLEELLAEK